MIAWWVNALGFQACWLAFVAGAGLGYCWTGFVALVPFAAYTLYRSPVARADALLMVMAALLGCVADSALIASGMVRFASPVPSTSIAPVWIVGLWIAFALTLNHSMAFLQQRRWLAAALGAVAGPVAYLIAANAWSALAFVAPAWHGVVFLAISWAIVTPLLAGIAAWLTRGPLVVGATAGRP